MLRWPPNFKPEEFAISGGTPQEVPSELWPVINRLAWQLQVLRDEIGRPVHIASGYRSPTYNAKIGRKPTSQHTKGTAADVIVWGMRPRKVARIIKQLIRREQMKEGGVGSYSWGTHYDIRGYRARW